MTELAVLQAIRLKGRVSRADLAATLGTDPDEIAGTVERLSAAGLVTGDATLWITPAGSARLTALLAEERRASTPPRWPPSMTTFGRSTPISSAW